MGLLKPLLKDISIGNRILPSLALRFADNTYQLDSGSGLEDKTFAQIITFTRTSGGGRFNASGNYEYLGNDVPRLDYDPVTLAPRGILIEEQRTNLLTYSSDFANAVWTKLGVTAVANAAVSPDGNNNATLLVETTGTGEHAVYRFLTLSANTHATTAYYKSAGVGYIKVSTNATPAGASESAFINLSSGAVSSSSFGDRLTVRVLANGWVEVRYTATNGVTGSQRNALYTLLSKDGVSTTYTGDGTSGIYTWGAQLEVGSFPTSYIPTVASQVTRSADVASVNTLSPWYNASAGTLFVEATGRRSATGGTFAVSLGAGSANYIGMMYTNTTAGSDTVYVSVSGSSAAIASDSARDKSSLSWDGATYTLVSDGVVRGTLARGIPAVSSLFIGRGHFGGATAGCHIRNISYYPRAYSGIVLQEMT